jgi:PAS domain S-box-containing protein
MAGMTDHVAVAATHQPPRDDEESRYRQLFENSPIGVINVALDGTPLMVNERAAASFGYHSPQEFLDNVPSMLDLWVDIKDRERAAEIMLEDGVLRDFEVLMKRRDGDRMMLSVSANPWRDQHGSVIGLQVSGIDVTARVRAEERLKEAQSHAAIAFWSWRFDTRVFSSTSELNVILGMEADLTNWSLAELSELVYPEDRDMVAMKVTTLRAGERFEMEFRVVTPDGEQRWVAARGCVDDGGTQISGSFQDITKQKSVETKLTELNEMKTEFVGVVAHDLMTPLTVSMGYAEFLRGQWDTIDDEKRRRFVEKIEGSLDRLRALVSGVSAITNIEAGSSVVDIVPFDIVELVRSAVDELASVESKISFEVRAVEGLPSALGDRESVWRVLTNLLSNAVKYTPSAELVTITVERIEEFLKVSVTDRGPGIALSDQPKLFQKFSRLAADHGGPRPPGSGLGLYICKSLVEACGGSIWVESARGCGSTFSFTVPSCNEPL